MQNVAQTCCQEACSCSAGQAKDEECRVELRVRGMDCPDCARVVETALGNLNGVSHCAVNFGTGRLQVKLDPAVTNADAIRAKVGQLGYRCLDPGGSPAEPLLDLGLPEVRLTLVAGFLLLLGALLGDGFWLYLASALCGGFTPAKRALGALRNKRIDMNTLMVISVVGAFSIGEAAEGATVICLFAVGEMLEGFAARRSHSALGELLDRQPQTVRLLTNGASDLVPVDQVHVGQNFEIRPGDVVPLDALVTEGHSAVDESAVTGESVPVEKSRGESIYGGTVNVNGRLVCQVLRPVGDSTLARVVRLVEQAQANKGQQQRTVDRFAASYTPAVIVMALGLAVLGPVVTGEPSTAWIYRALVILVIACPCALVISTPVSVVSALTAAARQGILIKGGTVLEGLARVRAVALDKTGTLTRGRVRVETLQPGPGLDSAGLLRLAASVEQGSEHPIADAVVQSFRSAGDSLAELSEFEALPGLGARATVDGRMLYVGRPVPEDSPVQELHAEGLTVIEVREGRTRLGLVGLSDQARPEGKEVCQQLRRMRLELAVLTGDHEMPARRITEELGLSSLHAGLFPQDKLEVVQSLRRQFGPVAMVGDGINDAPALAEADVGFAMGAAGSNVAIETADVALLGDDLHGIPRAVQLGRRTVAVIRQNVGFSILIKAVFLILAVAGLAGMWMAIAADMGASLAVTLNGLRLAVAPPVPRDTGSPCCEGGCCAE